MATGKRVVQKNISCYLCGLDGGMKVFCAHDECRMGDGRQTAFHVTCARQAGLEVGVEEGDEQLNFRGKSSRCRR